MSHALCQALELIQLERFSTKLFGALSCVTWASMASGLRQKMLMPFKHGKTECAMQQDIKKHIRCHGD